MQHQPLSGQRFHESIYIPMADEVLVEKYHFDANSAHIDGSVAQNALNLNFTEVLNPLGHLEHCPSIACVNNRNITLQQLPKPILKFPREFNNFQNLAAIALAYHG